MQGKITQILLNLAGMRCRVLLAAGEKTNKKTRKWKEKGQLGHPQCINVCESDTHAKNPMFISVKHAMFMPKGPYFLNAAAYDQRKQN